MNAKPPVKERTEEMGSSMSADEQAASNALVGSLPDQFPYRDVSFLTVDRNKKTCRLPWGPEIPLAPFFGIMAVGPSD